MCAFVCVCVCVCVCVGGGGGRRVNFTVIHLKSFITL